STLQAISLQQQNLADTPVAIGFDPIINGMLVATSVTTPPSGMSTFNGHTTYFKQVLADGTELPFATLPSVGLGDGATFAVVPDGNTAGFVPGDIFLPAPFYSGPSGMTNQIARVTNNGATVIDPWATINGPVGEVVLDTTGLFGGALLALTWNGQIYKITAAGTATLFVSGIPMPGSPDGTMIVVPNNSSYGPLAGTIVVGQDGKAGVSVSATGQLTTLAASGLNNAEGISIVPAAANFFALADVDSHV